MSNVAPSEAFVIFVFMLINPFAEFISSVGSSTLYNVCAVPWGVFSTVGGYHEYRGGIS